MFKNVGDANHSGQDSVLAMGSRVSSAEDASAIARRHGHAVSASSFSFVDTTLHMGYADKSGRKVRGWLAGDIFIVAETGYLYKSGNGVSFR